MGTWGAGVFENDAAEDLLDELGSVKAEDRTEVLRRVLAIPDSSEDDLRRKVDPAEVLAGIAVIAVNVSEGPRFSGEEDYPRMRSWLCGRVQHDLKTLSVRALNLVDREFGWYWDSWIDEKERGLALADVEKIRGMISV
ncbi:DUF4259 domain-containing protein [Nocardiopsis sp. NPDC006198]|uniref:DUF4259 domain-containing protein n=1 Tax=Nocardiopsis sp. NPDC006198 TaxID=3154472 RepID=UPI0033B4B59F